MSLLCSFKKSLTFVVSRDRSCLTRDITGSSLSPDRIIGNDKLRYLLKINMASSSLPMHVNFAARIAVERSLSLLTMTNKTFLGELHFYDVQFSFLSLPSDSVMTTSLLAQILSKTF